MSRRAHLISKVFLMAAVIVGVVLTSILLSSGTVQAAVSDDDIMKKALVGAMNACYSNRSNAFETPIDTNDYFYVDNVVKEWGEYVMPTDVGNSLGTTKINCREVFLGVKEWGGLRTKMQGLLSRFGKNENSVTPENLGYVASEGSSTSNYKCVQLQYHLFSSPSDYRQKTSNKVCFPVDGDWITIDNPQNVKLENESNVTAEMGSLKIEYNPGMDCISYSAQNPPAGMGWSYGGGYGCFAWGVSDKTISELVDEMNEYSSDISATIYDGDTSIQMYHAYDDEHRITASSSNSSNSLSSAMELNSDSVHAALRWLNGNNDGFTHLTFGPNDWAYLYGAYIKDLKEKAELSIDGDCVNDKNSSPYMITYDKGATWCKVTASDSVLNRQFAGQSGGSNKMLALMPLKDILTKYKNLDFNSVDSETLNDTIGTKPGTSDSGNTVTPGDTSTTIDLCYSAAASLGWIMCPVIQGASKVVSGIYDFMIKPFMEIKSSLLDSNGGNTSTYDGWKKFRDFSNVLFAIAFAVVILAQITGIGISNYNVKKILPRLIMVAVLVNVSFILCQVAVDISNILGSSLQKTFSDMAASVPQPSGNPYTLGGIVSSTAATLFTAAGVGGAVLGIAVTWEIWLLPFLLALVGCLLGVVFFFIILGIRQAGVILMVVLAPAAIVCYALPNTKSLFDRWRKLFTSLLLVYPICGLLLGVGQFASALLVAAGSGTEGFFFMLVAMLLSVVPFFFIPSILKGSMAAMGNLGLRVSQFGQNLSHRVNAGIRNSEMGRDAQRRLDMRNAARTYDRLTEKEARRGKLSASAQRRRSRAAMRYNRAAYEDIRAGGGARLLREGSPEYQAAIEGQERSQFNSDIEGRESLFAGGRMNSIISGQTDQSVNGDDDGALQSEFDAYLDKIVRGDGSAADIENYTRNAQAIANVLSSRGTGSARARVVESLSRAMHNNQGIFMDGANKARLAKDFGSIGSRLTAKYGKDYKKDFPGATAMFGDIAKGDFSRADSFRTFEDTDADGNRRQYLRSTYYSGQGVTGLSAEDFSRLKTSGLRSMLQGVRDGDITGAQLESLGLLATSVLDNSTLTPDADAIPYMQQIRSAAFTNRTQSGSVSGRSAGSLAIGSAGTQGIDSIFQQLQSAPEWSSMSADQKQTYRNLVSNISESYNSDRFAQGDALRLHDALKIAHDKGILDDSGQVVVAPRAPSGFDVRQEMAQQQAQQSNPLIITPGQLTDSERQAVREQAARINQNARRNGQQGGGKINGV